MIKVIYKYPFELSNGAIIEMKKGAEILSVQKQENTFCIWAKVNPHAENEERFFDIVGTGHLFKDGAYLTYLSTIQDGPFVWHIFERKKVGLPTV